MGAVQKPERLHIYQNHHLDSTRWDAYTPRDDDIIISTAYKSGTTWTQSIVRELIVHHLSPWLNPESLPLPDNRSSPWIDARFGDALEVMSERLETQIHRRFLKTHLPLDGLPFFPQVKYMVIGRDARDVFMSLWNHYLGYTDQFYQHLNQSANLIGKTFPRCPESVHLFWRYWITQGWFEWESEGFPFWGNMHHTQTWWNYRYLDNIQFFHYADMLANPRKEIQRMKNFLQIEVSDQVISTIIQKTSFSAMRERAIKRTESERTTFKDGAKGFFFKGTNDRWHGVLSTDELEMYQRTKSLVLNQACASWLEEGYSSIS